MSQAILKALKSLDVENDNHWTADNLPRLDTVKMLASDPTITRDTVNAAAPGFTREKAASYELPAQPAAIADPSSAPELQTTEGVQPESGAVAAAAPAPPPSPSTAPDMDDTGEQGNDSETTFSESEPEQTEVEEPGNGSDEVESLEKKVANAQEEIAQIEKSLAKGQSILNEKRQARDNLINKLSTLRPKDDTPSAIQQYLASQKELLMARGERRKLISESGLDLKQLAADVKSPLDAAMSKRKSRGDTRPKIGG